MILWKKPTWYIHILLKAKVGEVRKNLRQIHRKPTPSQCWGSHNRTTAILGNLFQQRSGQQDNGILLNAFDILKIYLRRDLDGCQLDGHQLWTLAVIWLCLLLCYSGSCTDCHLFPIDIILLGIVILDILVVLISKVVNLGFLIVSF